MPIQDPPSTRIRSDASTPRRRSSDPSLRRREDDRKSGTGWFGAFVTVMIAVLFLGYVFNIVGFATRADALFNSLNTSAQSRGDVAARVMAFLYPALGLMAAVLVVVGVLRFLMGGMKRFWKTRHLAKRDVMSLEAFKRITDARGIRPRIATQSYQLLLPYYRDSMRARLDDRLTDDLHMKAAQIQEVYANLLRNTDRKAASGDVPQLVTVMDLLNAVQNAQRQSLMNSVIRPAARMSGGRRVQKSPADERSGVTSA